MAHVRVGDGSWLHNKEHKISQHKKGFNDINLSYLLPQTNFILMKTGKSYQEKTFYDQIIFNPILTLLLKKLPKKLAFP